MKQKRFGDIVQNRHLVFTSLAMFFALSGLWIDNEYPI
jgi:hypothetical protein